MRNSTGLGIAGEHVSVTYAVSDKPIGCVAGQTPEAGYITREEDIVLILSAETGGSAAAHRPYLSRARRRRPRRRA